MIKRIAGLGGLFILAAVVSLPAHGGYIITIAPSGSDIVATGGGSMDMVGLNSPQTFQEAAWINGGEAQIHLGSVSNTSTVLYSGAAGPAAFGTKSTNLFANSGSGPTVTVVGNVQRISVPVGYVSGRDLGTSTDTWSNQSLASLGLTVGNYQYTWGSGAHADSLTVQIIPEPTKLGSVIVAGMALCRRGRAVGKGPRYI